MPIVSIDKKLGIVVKENTILRKIVVAETSLVVEKKFIPKTIKMSKKTVAKSGRSLTSFSAPLLQNIPEYETPLDSLHVKIRSLRIHDEDCQPFGLNVSYFNQLIMSSVIIPIGAKEPEPVNFVEGSMSYDPSDYEKMCLFADCPLVVTIHPITAVEAYDSEPSANTTSRTTTSRIKSESKSNIKSSSAKSNSAKSNSGKSDSIIKITDVSCCNVDIIPVFLGDEEVKKICVRKRMEPMIRLSALRCKSWDCLPLLTMEVWVVRHQDNSVYHTHLKDANWMRLTLVASYNMFLADEQRFTYTAASRTPLYCESNTGEVIFNDGTKLPHNYNPTNFYPKWESLNKEGNLFSKDDVKLIYDLKDLRNEANLDLHHYISQIYQYHTIVWGSFHRSLMIDKPSEQWFAKQIQQYKWPLEIHVQCEDSESVDSLMALLNLFPLLYPGERIVRLAVPLQWLNQSIMMQECNYSPLVESTRPVSPTATTHRADRTITEVSLSTEVTFPANNTGADDNPAFVIVEVRLARPLRKVVIPTRILKTEIDQMLKAAENLGPIKRRCTGRDTFTKSWQSAVQLAVTALRRVPYFGTTEFSIFVRQLSETKTRVELTTTCWQDGALFVNNNFVVQQYLHSEEIFEEMLMMTHACLVQLACDQLLESNQEDKDCNPVRRAARQAKQMGDNYHAMDLFLQVAVTHPRDPNIWRELSTCLKDIDRDWARVCINESVLINPRHPLTLLSICGMVFEENPEDAEQFIEALISYYPFWVMGWVVASVYYYDRQLFAIYDSITKMVYKNQREWQAEEVPYTHGWEHELGDWWDPTELLPGMSHFYEAADLLLRLRCITLAELCIARALNSVGESATYYHLVALCCRLRGEYNDAVCHLRTGLKKYGNIYYMKSLLAECYHMLGNIPEALACYDKSHTSIWPHTILMMLPIYTDCVQRLAVLWDLTRRHPCSYTWMAMAHSCTTPKEEHDTDIHHHTNMADTAIACAIQALKWDRMAGSAWALLAKSAKPSARRHFCLKMASLCSNKIKDRVESDAASRQSSCYRLGIAITECNCRMCARLRV